MALTTSIPDLSLPAADVHVEWTSRDAGARHPQAPSLPSEPLPFVLHFVRQYLGWYLFILFLEICGSVSATILPYLVGSIVRIVTQTRQHPELIWSAIFWPMVFFVIFNIAEVIFVRAGGSCRAQVNPSIRRSVTQELYAYLQYHSHRFINNDFAGALAHRISDTSQGVGMSMATIVFDFFPVLVKLLVSCGLLFYVSLPLGTFIGLWAVIYLILSFRLARECQPHAHRHAAARSQTNGTMVDSVTNLSSVRLFARLPYEREYLNQFLATEVSVARVSMAYLERIHWFQYTAAVVLKIGVMLLAAYLWRYGKIDIAGFVMSVSLALLIISELRSVSRRFFEFFEFIGNIGNGVHAIIRPHEILDAPDARPLVVGRGAIEFRNVIFGYSPEKIIFEYLNLAIRPGERVGLVGYSGSGKSTLVNLLLRLYDPQQGEILIDGTDIKSVTQESLHGQISIIPQDPGLFHRSLMENIRYGNLEADEEDVRQAATLAHAHDFIEQMPRRYDSLVGERGVKLSGGQRQRIAIARVIAKNAPILILDEATSSLDSMTERAIQESLETVMKDKTVLVVAHRLSTIANLDRILVFDQGRLVEDGSHFELLGQDGTYARLWNGQVDGFLPERAREENEPELSPAKEN